MTGKQLVEKEESHKLPVSHHIELIFSAWKDGFSRSKGSLQFFNYNYCPAKTG